MSTNCHFGQYHEEGCGHEEAKQWKERGQPITWTAHENHCADQLMKTERCICRKKCHCSRIDAPYHWWKDGCPPIECTTSFSVAEEAEPERIDASYTGATELPKTPDYSLLEKLTGTDFVHLPTLKEEQARIKALIVEEINIARSESEPTSRLESLYNKINSLN